MNTRRGSRRSARSNEPGRRRSRRSRQEQPDQELVHEKPIPKARLESRERLRALLDNRVGVRVRTDQFVDQAIVSLQSIHGTLFAQAQTEALRLPRINAALDLLEQHMLDPDTVDELDPEIKVALLSVMQRNARSSARLLIDLAKMSPSWSGDASNLHDWEAIQAGRNGISLSR